MPSSAVGSVSSGGLPRWLFLPVLCAVVTSVVLWEALCLQCSGEQRGLFLTVKSNTSPVKEVRQLSGASRIPPRHREAAVQDTTARTPEPLGRSGMPLDDQQTPSVQLEPQAAGETGLIGNEAGDSGAVGETGLIDNEAGWSGAAGETAALDDKAGESGAAGETTAMDDEAGESRAAPAEGVSPQAEAYKYAFKLLEPASLSYSDVQFCPDANEPAAGDIRTLHPGMNMLMVVGVQKGGTTWMSSALMKHPDLIQSQGAYGYKARRSTKEVHYLDLWPFGSEQAYIDLYPADRVNASESDAAAQLKRAGVDLAAALKSPKGVLRAYEQLQHEVAFMDASPNYLPTPHAAPRASQIMPHARIVIVLRDPVARALSAFNMDRGRYCGLRNPRRSYFLPWTECPPKAFEDTVEAVTGVKGRGRLCAFDGLDRGPLQTWQDCYQCYHMFYNTTHCQKLPKPRPFNDCKPDILTYIHVSNYAPQIAWWLAFFPPEQILILTSEELRDPNRQVQALNKILSHARLPKARRFTADWLHSMDLIGFSGEYSKEDDLSIRKGIRLLRRRFRKPMKDLRRLINTYWPEMNFTGLAEEV